MTFGNPFEEIILILRIIESKWMGNNTLYNGLLRKHFGDKTEHHIRFGDSKYFKHNMYVRRKNYHTGHWLVYEDSDDNFRLKCQESRVFV